LADLNLASRDHRIVKYRAVALLAGKVHGNSAAGAGGSEMAVSFDDNFTRPVGNRRAKAGEILTVQVDRAAGGNIDGVAVAADVSTAQIARAIQLGLQVQIKLVNNDIRRRGRRNAHFSKLAAH